MTKDRKATYKVPPSFVTNAAESQELRRRKALDEQKRKRAQRVNSSRQLDIFAQLNLGDSDDEEEPHAPIHPETASSPPTKDGSSRKKRKQKAKKPPAKNKWADQCMYAEMLEMSETGPQDGLPEDLETAWVAVAPVPVGKRCLAVTDQNSGPGHVSNTSLRSRKQGKFLMPRFASILPPSSVLDCILDDNWRENGILHVLDVLKWKGQDIMDCEAPFRFWWRDTRLAELPVSPPPSKSGDDGSNVYRFPHPSRFFAIPHHTDTSLPSLLSRIIPLARTTRSITVDVPNINTESDAMAVDQMVAMQQQTAEIRADGLLLYVSEASYETGPSPLSSWVPIANYESSDIMVDVSADGPLNVFQRLIEHRIRVVESQMET
ncbi:hypothetical protein FB45DRAFT_907973 [Roridomyces roridus]|uniref:Snurportin-1 n=1 Tax=Roridomyces roridus TaxID=1738132 RepID=A0AAD7C3X4_9AGAR|nr:hypothetical protein FB45DRAFT_907973 [Roridomyces roridus]